MNDDSGVARTTSLKTMVGVEGNRSIVLPVDQIVVSDEGHPTNDAKVSELAKSIGVVGLLSVLVVCLRKGQDGKEEYHLVAGRHRLQALKLLNVVEAQCTVLPHDDVLRVELAGIDENLMRNDPSPAEHALLTGRRREILGWLALQDGTLSQDETASRQAKRRAGQKTGPDVASVRDLASKTGVSKDKIHRSTKLFDTLGPDILKSVARTSLDSGAQLNALTKLADEVRHELANSAAAGADVSASRVLRDQKREAIEVSASQVLRDQKREAIDELQHQSPVSILEQACRELADWIGKYNHWLPNNLFDQFCKFRDALRGYVYPGHEEDE